SNLNPRKITTLKKVITAGEKTNFELVNKWKGKIEYINAYGPTETTICVSTWSSFEADNEYKSVPIGKPIFNTQVYVLDKDDNLAPIGVIGELCVSGETLARGYLNRPALTKEKFTVNPYTSEKMYRTGDLVRWLNDGNLEFISRKDNQIKIRGFRIEPGEIENLLRSYPGIIENIVLDRVDTNGDKYLCCYLTAEDKKRVSSLREYLAKELPDYMIPSYFVQLEQLPFTPNGKIDRKSLPQPDGRVTTEYVAPTNQIEDSIVTIWSEVLNTAKVGIYDNFFELGGHSLKGVSIASKINQKFNIEISLKDIFKSSTVKELAEVVSLAEEKRFSSIEKVEDREYYPLSSAQKRFFILNQLESDTTSYNMPNLMLIDGEINLERLEKAFKDLVERHEALRTSFDLVNGEPMQKIHKDLEFNLEYMEGSKREVEKIISEFIRPFELRKAPLFRVKVLKIVDQYLLMYDMHHIIADGISMNILINEWSLLYRGKELPDLRIHYKDFAVWQKHRFQISEIKNQEEFWLEMFKGELPVLNMPTDFTRSKEICFKGDLVNFEVTRELTARLNQLSKKNGATLYMTLLSAYYVLLSKYSGQEDIVVGSPSAGRFHAELDQIIGLFINTLAMRAYPKNSKTFAEFLLEIKENSLRAYNNQDYPFERLVEKLNVERDLSRSPLFDVMFTMQNMEQAEIKFDDFKFTPYQVADKESKFDMTLRAVEINNKIKFMLEYSIGLYQKETMQRLLSHFVNILNEITQNLEIELREIEMLASEEKNELLFDFNDTSKEYLEKETIYQLFEELVEREPDKIAVCFEDQKISFKELNAKANQLAGVLQEKGVQADTSVGLIIDRSVEMITGILGILKAGGAYLPMDSGYPTERIEYMIKDSGTELLLTNSKLQVNFDLPIEVIDIESISANYNFSNQVSSSSNNLAYIIYTSGSTGKPKGVAIEHASLVNYIHWFTETGEITSKDSSVLLSSYAFDLGYTALWSSLVRGATLHIVAENIYKDGNLLIDYLSENSITFIKVTPSLFNMLVNSPKFMSNEGLNSLRLIVLGGEKIRVNDLERYHQKYPEVIFMNHYGPTEATIGCLSILVDQNKFADFVKKPVIGRPNSNMKAYILDQNNQIQPMGVMGELCISGVGLAREYLNRPEHTKERFIENPFVSGERLYKTGDLARWQQDGMIEFIGRIDHQIKIRGYRVEVGEIEKQLLNHNAITEAVVIDKEDGNGDRYLSAYIVSDLEFTVSEIRSDLSKGLPSYMIPSYFVQLDELPLTPNGKLDRKALPEPQGSIKVETSYLAPRNSNEVELVKIWSELLEVEKIGINDNFFDLGGHSLKATQLTARVFKEMNVELPLREIFAKPTVEELAEYIRAASKSIYAAIEPVEDKNYYQLSSAQKRMFFINQLNHDNTSYNMPIMMIIEGELNQELLQNVFKELVRRHEAFRTSIEQINGEPVQRIHKDIDNLDIINFKAEENELKTIVMEFIKPFDLTKAPLLRVGLIEVTLLRHLFLFDMHHIIADGVSRVVLINEFIDLYSGKELPKLRIQYKDFAAWQDQLFESDLIKTQEKYWLDTFADEVPVLDLPTDYPRSSVTSYEGDGIYFSVEKELRDQLYELASSKGATMYMILLAAYNVLLFKYTDQEDIVVGLPTAGRPHADLEKIIGMFVNTLAMRNYPQSHKTFARFLSEVKEKALEAFESQDYQFEMLVDRLGLARDFGRNPLFDTLFALQNIDHVERTVNGLKFIPYKFENNVAKHDLALYAVEMDEGIQFTLRYKTELFMKETIEEIAGNFIKILNAVVENSEIQIKDIEVESDVELLESTPVDDFSFNFKT
ncbi:MAG: amino acid adenylation domain-containing protein, partial [Halanaerobiales bacterium]|nr:amino acid adenylation domain-containing protein [Halanaerobiales bacterium]